MDLECALSYLESLYDLKMEEFSNRAGIRLAHCYIHDLASVNRQKDGLDILKDIEGKLDNKEIILDEESLILLYGNIGYVYSTGFLMQIENTDVTYLYKNFNEAYKYYEKVFEVDYLLKSDYAYSIAICYLQDKEYERAKEYIELLIENDEPEGYYLKALTYYYGLGVEKNYFEVSSLGEKCLNLYFNEDPDVCYLLSEAYTKLNEKEKAEKYYAIADNNNSVLLNKSIANSLISNPESDNTDEYFLDKLACLESNYSLLDMTDLLTLINHYSTSSNEDEKKKAMKYQEILTNYMMKEENSSLKENNQNVQKTKKQVEETIVELKEEFNDVIKKTDEQKYQNEEVLKVNISSMNAEIAALFKKEEYQEAVNLCRKLLIDNENNARLWYDLFLAENDNYIHIDYEDIKNEMAFNEAVKLATDEEKKNFISEYNFYKNISTVPFMRETFRYIQMGMFENAKETFHQAKVKDENVSISTEYKMEFYEYLYQVFSSMNEYPNIIMLSALLSHILYLQTKDKDCLNVSLKLFEVASNLEYAPASYHLAVLAERNNDELDALKYYHLAATHSKKSPLTNIDDYYNVANYLLKNSTQTIDKQLACEMFESVSINENSKHKYDALIYLGQAYVLSTGCFDKVSEGVAILESVERLFIAKKIQLSKTMVEILYLSLAQGLEQPVLKKDSKTGAIIYYRDFKRSAMFYEKYLLMKSELSKRYAYKIAFNYLQAKEYVLADKYINILIDLSSYYASDGYYLKAYCAYFGLGRPKNKVHAKKYLSEGYQIFKEHRDIQALSYLIEKEENVKNSEIKVDEFILANSELYKRKEYSIVLSNNNLKDSKYLQDLALYLEKNYTFTESYILPALIKYYSLSFKSNEEHKKAKYYQRILNENMPEKSKNSSKTKDTLTNDTSILNDSITTNSNTSNFNIKNKTKKGKKYDPNNADKFYLKKSKYNRVLGTILLILPILFSVLLYAGLTLININENSDLINVILMTLLCIGVAELIIASVNKKIAYNILKPFRLKYKQNNRLRILGLVLMSPVLIVLFAQPIMLDPTFTETSIIYGILMLIYNIVNSNQIIFLLIFFVGFLLAHFAGCANKRSDYKIAAILKGFLFLPFFLEGFSLISFLKPIIDPITEMFFSNDNNLSGWLIVSSLFIIGAYIEFYNAMQFKTTFIKKLNGIARYIIIDIILSMVLTRSFTLSVYFAVIEKYLMTSSMQIFWLIVLIAYLIINCVYIIRSYDHGRFKKFLMIIWLVLKTYTFAYLLNYTSIINIPFLTINNYFMNFVYVIAGTVSLVIQLVIAIFIFTFAIKFLKSMFGSD